MAKTYTKVTDTEFTVSEQVTQENTITLDQLELEKLRLLEHLNKQATQVKTRVTEIDEEITALKSAGAKTQVEVEDERQAQEKADRETKLAEEKAKVDKIGE